MEEKTVYLKFLAESDWISSRYFNENAYPENVKKLVSACLRRFSLASENLRNMHIQYEQDMSIFLKWVNDEITKIVTKKDLIYEVSYESPHYISNLYMIFIMIKSFLDIWTRVGATLIDSKAKIYGFHKAKINNEQLAGGNYINWLQRSVPQTRDIKSLNKLVYGNVKSWINDVVKYRDQIIHYGEIKNLKPVRIIIKEKPKTKYKKSDLIQASMPNNISVLDYCQDIVSNLNSFTMNCIKLLPNIRNKYLSLKQ